MHLSQRLLVVFLMGTILHMSWAAAAPAEKQKIEALIAKVASLEDARFVRNGSEYNSKNAAKFLRAKWSSNDAEISTAQDFIAKAGTGSSTSGKPYLIRFKEGREVPCGDYLKGELAKLPSAEGK